MPGFINFQKGKLKGVNNVKISEKESSNEESKIRSTVRKMILLTNAIRKTKGDGAYEIKSPSVDWGEKENAIEIHCDAGGNSD